jgi:hypothetical protein
MMHADDPKGPKLAPLDDPSGHRGQRFTWWSTVGYRTGNPLSSSYRYVMVDDQAATGQGGCYTKRLT